MEGKFNKSLMTTGGAKRFASRSGSSLDGGDKEEKSIKSTGGGRKNRASRSDHLHHVCG